MSVEKVKEYFKQFGRENDVMEKEMSSATVALAATALGVSEGEIAKTLSFKGEDENTCILIVTAGDTKVNNGKFKRRFSAKPTMLSYDDAEKLTGHSPGGVCPFANPEGVQTYIDESVKRFDYIYPACGSSNSMIKLTPEELFKYGNAVDWVDVCKYIDET